MTDLPWCIDRTTRSRIACQINVLEEIGSLLPVQLKASTSAGIGDARHLRKFREVHQNAPRGILLSGDPVMRMLAPGIIAPPWWAVV